MFQIPDDERYAMERPPLVRAVVELSFPFSSALARVLTDQGLVELQAKLSDQFPSLSREPAATGSVVAGGEAEEQRGRYVFTSPDGYELLISPSNASLAIDHRYQNRSAFGAKLVPVTGIIGDVGQLKRIERIGVRYVNARQASPEEWGAWFKPAFVGWINDAFVPKTLLRGSMQIAQIAADERQTATIRYGYLPVGVGPDITSNPEKDEASFLADIDIASEEPFAFDPDEIGRRFQALNHDIAHFLIHSLTDEGKAQFGVHPIDATTS